MGVQPHMRPGAERHDHGAAETGPDDPANPVMKKPTIDAVAAILERAGWGSKRWNSAGAVQRLYFPKKASAMAGWP
jgi:hypothetical protein